MTRDEAIATLAVILETGGGPKTCTARIIRMPDKQTAVFESSYNPDGPVESDLIRLDIFEIFGQRVAAAYSEGKNIFYVSHWGPAPVTNPQNSEPVEIYSRPECPFNYCDNENGAICKEIGHCRHAPEVER